eukprot:142249-Pyramimonas_sp.AAC.1
MALPAMFGQLAGEERGAPPRTRRDRAQLQEVHAVVTTGAEAQTGREPRSEKGQDIPLLCPTPAGS